MSPAEPPPGEPGWSLIVDPGSDGQRLDRFLSRRITRLSRARAARLTVIDLDDPQRRMKKSTPVRAGQRLWAQRPLPDGHAEPSRPTVLHRDADLLVLDKPSDLAVHPTATRFKATVTRWLVEQRGEGGALDDGAGPAEPAHRLDVETSGVLLCTRHRLAARRVKNAFAAGQVRKVYRAVVEGSAPDAWRVDTPLGFDPSSAVRLKMGRGAQSAETEFVTVGRGPRRSLVEARPITGRQHQIRVHLAQSGHPIVGDKLYGPDERYFLAALEGPLDAAALTALGHHRHALHAWRLSVDWAGAERRFEARWPAELDALLSR